jgi:replicative DNA helicase
MMRHTKLPLHIIAGNRNIESICGWIRDMRNDIKLVGIDYVQRITPSMSDPRNDREMLTRWSRLITNVANETGVSVIALCQLNREAEFDRNGNRISPQPKHLKGTGAFEEDAYQVILIARGLELEGDEEWDDNQPTVIKIAYNRGGPTGAFNFRFMKSKQRLVPEEEAINEKDF